MNCRVRCRVRWRVRAGSSVRGGGRPRACKRRCRLFAAGRERERAAGGEGGNGGAQRTARVLEREAPHFVTRSNAIRSGAEVRPKTPLLKTIAGLFRVDMSQSAAHDEARHLLSYCLRQGLARGVVAVADGAGATADTTVVLGRALGLARDGRWAGAIRDAESLRGRRDGDYPALVALSALLRASGGDDTAAVAALPASLAAAPPAALVAAAGFAWAAGDA